jgi:hypothetical protein
MDVFVAFGQHGNLNPIATYYSRETAEFDNRGANLQERGFSRPLPEQTTRQE